MYIRLNNLKQKFDTRSILGLKYTTRRKKVRKLNF